VTGLEYIAAFRVPSDRLLKLPSRPGMPGHECLFVTWRTSTAIAAMFMLCRSTVACRYRPLTG
jgi:hypothetical protein